MEYYVYVAKYGDEIVYIGKGSGSRFRHLNSGTSNCYQANKIHFEGGSVDSYIYATFPTSEEALIFEKELIGQIKPSWNIMFVKVDDRVETTNRGNPKKGVSNFMGVTYNKKPVGGKNANTVPKYWRAKVHYKGKCIHIGNYTREVDAAIARDLYIINNKLQGFILNFPEKNYSDVLDSHLEWD